jgi:hypothetical protein
MKSVAQLIACLVVCSLGSTVGVQTSSAQERSGDGQAVMLESVKASVESACPLQVCDPVAAKAAAEAAISAVKLAKVEDLSAILALDSAISAVGAKPPAPLRDAARKVWSSYAAIANAEHERLLASSSWTEARGFVAAQVASTSQFSAATRDRVLTWIKAARTAESKFLSRVFTSSKPRIDLDGLVALVDLYATILSEGPQEAVTQKTFVAMQKTLGDRLTKDLQGLLVSYDYDAAEELISTHSARLQAKWVETSKKAIEKKKSVTTELVDSCSKEKTWEACTASLEALSSACASSEFTCNPTARSALRNAMNPIVARRDTTEEQRLALGRATDEFDMLKRGDPILALGETARSMVRRDIESQIRAVISRTNDYDFGSGRGFVERYRTDLGEAWATRMEAMIDGAEQAKQAADEAAEQARIAGCMSSCLSMVISCGSGPEFSPCEPYFESCCNPAPADCRYLCKGFNY